MALSVPWPWMAVNWWPQRVIGGSHTQPSMATRTPWLSKVLAAMVAENFSLCEV